MGPKNSGLRMPSGIPYIVLNEAAERYSFYGMRAILTVFMTQFLIRRGGGLDLMTEAESKVWYHGFVTAVYFFPIIGALISDIFLGKYRTIIVLSLVYCLGHVALAVDHTRLGLSIGLTLIAIGAGGIKPCVSAHVGDQFDDSNKILLEKVFAWFYFAINVGSFVSMMLSEVLLRHFGPHVAFGIPGVLMLLATIVFYMGRRKFVAMPAAGWKTYRRDLFGKRGRNAILRLLPLYFFVAAFWALYDQTGSSWVIQAQSAFVNKHFDLGFLHFDILPSQVQAVNPFLILLYIPLFAVFVYPWINKHIWRLSPLRKIGIGLFITVIPFAILGWMQTRVDGGLTIHVGWQILATAVLTAAEIMVSITCLEFSYTQAPNSMKSFIMGLYLLSISAGNFLAAGVNEWIQKPVEIQAIQTGAHTFIELPAGNDIRDGQKLMLEGENGINLSSVAGGQSSAEALQGTFTLFRAEGKTGRYELKSVVDWSAVQSTGTYSPGDDFSPMVNKLKGAAYFWFFTLLMLGAACCFTLAAYFYVGQTYIQDHSMAEKP